MDETGRQEELAARAKGEIEKASTREELESLRVAYLGRKSEVMRALRAISGLPQEERRAAGITLNKLKRELEESLKARMDSLPAAGAAQERIDLSFPGRTHIPGSVHPITFTIRDIMRILQGLGFERAEGPECETDYNNFVALNTPEDHPARDMQDTFFLGEGLLLRTQTSAVWAHVMKKRSPPLRVACPGRTFRRDAADATHAPVFHQVEGLWIDDKCRFSDLKGVLTAFLREYFGPGTNVRFDPSYFPFTEPSAEVSIQCVVCGGTGCKSCGRTGWLELLGAGMVHPNILAKAGGPYAKRGVRGLAFGIGVERMAMMKYRITDMRWLFENDLRVLSQFSR